MRGAITVFLAVILIGCQSAPAVTATITPLTPPGKTPLPSSTNTPVPTSTTAPIATISPAELLRRASRICENAFSALVESGPLTAPFAVLKKAAYADIPSWEASHQLPHLGSLSPAEVQTVFCISETRIQTGT